jgi:hypothetical protein
MKISLKEWEKQKGSFEDKKLESFLKAIPKLHESFFKDQSAANERILLNNIKGLEDRAKKLRAENKGDKEKLKALDGLDALIKNGYKQLDADRALQAQGLKAHLDLRTSVDSDFKRFEAQIKRLAGDVKNGIADTKQAMKDKSRDETLAQREVLLGHIRLLNGIEEDMKNSLMPVRNPTGGMKKALQYLSTDTKKNVIIPETNKLFTYNKQLLTALRKIRGDAETWADNAQKVAPKLQ